jgi:hypothetical protein
MMRGFPILIRTAALLALTVGLSAAGILELDSVKSFLMDPNGISPHDIDLFPLRAKPDAYRLSRVEAILRSPFRIDAVATEIMARTAASASPRASVTDTLPNDLPVSPDSLWPLLDVASAKAAPAPTTTKGHGLKDFRPEDAFKAIRAGLREHVAGLSEAERDFLFREASGLFLQEEEDTARGAIEGEMSRLEDDARIHRLMALAGKLRWPGLVSAASAAWSLETWIISSVRADGAGPTVARLKKASAAAGGGDFPIHSGGKGADRHHVDKGIWIDAGGDDEYVLEGPDKPGVFLLIVDMGGNDLYISKDSLDRSPGNMGIDLIADLGGNDRYLGTNFAFGSTLFGYASIYDAAGHDTYEGRCASLGFGFFGLGVIEDRAGNDVYSASLMSEGVGSTMGMGLLLDRAGNDQYLARPTFQDDLRYTDHNIHMVQGFGIGFSPDFAGGIGILRDGGGNDLYVADIFGQGAAYWYALGMLIDESGDDRYEAHQYAQGAGVHIAVGALLDFGGNDHHASKGVSQGCGHDLGFGLLYDKSGDDNYLATDMSQGAGSANGLGILQDAAGSDIYESLNTEMALGHADMRRDRGSFGFFLDGGGTDRYRRPQGDGSAWRVFNGKTKGNGFGFDR